MMTFPARRSVGAFLVVFLAAAFAHAADSSTKAPTKAGTSNQRPGAAARGGRGPLPDPSLLDGSTIAAEKKSEYGMIGDFELPGDENARSDKVGGPPRPGGNVPGLPAPGVSLPGLPATPGLPAPGLPGVGLPQAGLPQIGLPSGGSGPQNGNAAGAAIGGAGDSNGTAEGRQVAQIGGEASGDQSAGGNQKPTPVAIGDQAMRIPQGNPSAAGVLGGQQQVQGNTQHHEKGTGSGGKPPTGVQGNNRSERGRAIPAGL